MKAGLRHAAMALVALTAVSTAACSTPPSLIATGTVTRYRVDTRSSGSAYFELEGVRGVFYCDARYIHECATTKDGDAVTVVYYENAYGWLRLTELKRAE